MHDVNMSAKGNTGNPGVEHPRSGIAEPAHRGSPPPEIRASGSFVLRTPLLPRDTLGRWGDGLAVPAVGDDIDRLAAAIEADRITLRTRLAQLVARAEVREAIFLASPGLEASIAAWVADPSSEAGQKTERGLVRYLARMSARPTPFGLFAGNTVGAIGETTRLELAPRARYQRYTRIDGDYLSALTDALAAEPSIRAHLVYRPNTSLHQFAGRLRYAMRREGRGPGKGRSYPLVGIEPFDQLIATISLARAGVRLADLSSALCDADAKVTRDDADGFIRQLVDRQILVPDLAPLVTGSEAAEDIIAQLAALPDVALAREAVAALRAIRAAFGQLDERLGNPPAHYRGAAAALAALPAKPDIQRLFQVNLVPTATCAELGRDVVDEIARGVDVARRLARPSRADDLARFRDAFVERYDAREVPLAEALDEESGIGSAASRAPSRATSPLLHGLPFPDPATDAAAPWPARAAYLARKIASAEAEGAAELVLDEADLAAMDATGRAALPDAFQALVTLATAPGGELRILLRLSGTGTGLLGRFCHDPAMRAAVDAHIAAEQALRPGVVFAEIVHLAEGRLANVTARPVLRSHEIVYLGRSGAPRDRQIELSDLLVSVRNGRIVLRSRSLDREIVPRLTNAHNFQSSTLGTYRFLASLQDQGMAQLGLELGPLAQLPFVPRIRIGRVVVVQARWTLRRAELEPVTTATGVARIQALARLRVAARLPRWVCVENGDAILPVDLDNVLAVDSFAQLVKSARTVTLTELWPEPSALAVAGPDGRYATEIVVPFVRVRSGEPAPASVRDALVAPPHAPPTRRTFAPGSEWLYAKLYTGHTTADQILTEAIAPIAGDCACWFFLRYGDPHWHVRFRVRGEPAWLVGELMPRLHARTRDMLDDGRLWRLQLDTYERETERYGGPVGVELAERLFCADSTCALDLLGMLDGDAGGDDARWRLTLRGIDQLLRDLGLDLAARLAVMRRSRNEFAREHHADSSIDLRRAMGDRYRKEQRALQALLDPAHDARSELAPGLERLAGRSQANAPIIEELRVAERRGTLSSSIIELAPSYVHMSVNRMIRSAQRNHELVLYDLLVRLYESRLARAKQQAPQGAGS